jgi:endogenous inhibitor of DNA gyrase (YacG/DUF329 family)
MRGLPCARCGKKVGVNYVKQNGKIFCGTNCADIKKEAPVDAHAVTQGPFGQYGSNKTD